GWELARTWSGTRARERQIKAQGGAARHCPVCKSQPPQVAATPIEASYRVAVPAPRQAPAPVPPVPEPPLWEFIVSHLEAAEAAALLAELDAAERAAWSAATPAAGPEYEPRFRVACEVSRLRGEEASAVVRLAEARAIAEADGWDREPGGPDFDPGPGPDGAPSAVRTRDPQIEKTRGQEMEPLTSTGTTGAEPDDPARTADFGPKDYPEPDDRGGREAATADEATWNRYAHGTGPEPHTYQLSREPAAPQHDDRGTIPREYMGRLIDGMYAAPEREPEMDREAGQ
ncbi:MAG: hypothetical protein ACLP7J_04485, partial [Streptosporangiaceae bacterium]